MGNTIKLVPSQESEQEWLARIEQESGTSINLCYQCGKCSAGCPVGFAMDYTPRQVIRLLQLNLIEEALNTETIWLCASCDTCSSRCPRGVDIASLMDTLKKEALARGKFKDKRVALFNEAFLDGVRNFGRSYEVGILLKHNLKTLQPFKDAELGLPMLSRGKANLMPKKIKGREHIKKIFARAEKAGGEQE
ncbi:MAG: 4Fe-4S dicluster domain-containing protein [Syntrophomonadaceae bacterium]|jgi:heterodisulfide reductase subunit C